MNDSPTLPLLQRFLTPSGRLFNIIERIGIRNHYLGIRLLNDDHGAITAAIEARHRPDLTEAVLQRWLEGAGRTPRTWATLITVLRRIGLNALAQDIETGIVFLFSTKNAHCVS